MGQGGLESMEAGGWMGCVPCSREGREGGVKGGRRGRERERLVLVLEIRAN